jgi:hypothetical protein
MSLNPIDLVKEYLRTEPARLIAYGVAATLTAANAIGHALGYETLPDGVANGLTLLVTALVTEAIRRLVYAPATVEDIVDEVAAVGDTDAVTPAGFDRPD